MTGKIARQQCQGELQLPLSDCGVVALDYRGRKGIATAIGHAPQAGLASPEAGSVLSVAESLTNLVWAPLADGLKSVSLSANWMWPCRSQEGEDARLYKAVEALSDFCCAIGVNVPTGKDSLSMTQQYPNGEKIIAPGTVIVSSGGEVSDVRKVVSPVVVNDKRSSLYHIDFSFCEQRLGGSAFAQSLGKVGSDVPTVDNPEYFVDCFNAVQELIRRGWVMAGHDISAGGLITTLLEMTFANTRGGLHINLHDICSDGDITKTLFAENPGVVIQVSDEHKFDLREFLEDVGVGFAKIGYPVENSREIEIVLPTPNTQHPTPNTQRITIRGASGNNLKHVDAEFPLGKLIVVTGVSGSGKSTLINETLQPILSQHFYRSLKRPMPYDSIEGIENIDKVVNVDQSPIGRTPRSNPATYTGVFSDIRSLFVSLPEAKIRGYKPGRFSFNVKGGRCETCGGNGYKTIEMNFLPDVMVPCETCHGKRYNRETLEVRYKGKSIADVLDMTINQAVEFFENVPTILQKIKTMQDVGLGYIKLGQSSTTLSGGESQRVKLATELAKRDTGRTLYILDEPTTGLHFEDISILMQVLNRLVEKGNTIIIIEHNLDVIKLADHIIDMGPEGGRNGGTILSTGTPEEVARSKKGYTPKFLREELKKDSKNHIK